MIIKDLLQTYSIHIFFEGRKHLVAFCQSCLKLFKFFRIQSQLW
jgi:hypothetical protein